MRNIFTSSRYKIVETFVLIGVKLLLLRYFFTAASIRRDCPASCCRCWPSSAWWSW